MFQLLSAVQVKQLLKFFIVSIKFVITFTNLLSLFYHSSSDDGKRNKTQTEEDEKHITIVSMNCALRQFLMEIILTVHSVDNCFSV